MFNKNENKILFIILILIIIICLIGNSIKKNNIEKFYVNIETNFNDFLNQLNPVNTSNPPPPYKEILIDDLLNKTNIYKAQKNNINQKLNNLDYKLDKLTYPNKPTYNNKLDTKYKYLKSYSHYN
jgi:hypothetical protein